MAQYALPTSDVSKGTWVQFAGDGDADAFDELDEGFGAGRGTGSGPDDGTTAWRHGSDIDAGSTIELGLSSVTDPASSTGHVYRTRHTKTNTGGKTLDVTIALYQSTTLIASQVFAGFDTASYTTHSDTLSSAEADSITNYGALRIRVTAAWSGGGAARSLRESAVEFECPDAAAVQDTPELRGRPYGLRGATHMHQILAR